MFMYMKQAKQLTKLVVEERTFFIASDLIIF